ncbi:unnamed protein product, partial [Urochloa humidicola]
REKIDLISIPPSHSAPLRGKRGRRAEPTVSGDGKATCLARYLAGRGGGAGRWRSSPARQSSPMAVRWGLHRLGGARLCGGKPGPIDAPGVLGSGYLRLQIDGARAQFHSQLARGRRSEGTSSVPRGGASRSGGDAEEQGPRRIEPPWEPGSRRHYSIAPADHTRAGSGNINAEERGGELVWLHGVFGQLRRRVTRQAGTASSCGGRATRYVGLVAAR